MTLQQLRYVVTVADKGSITEAAKDLFISQPSLSAAIKELEREIKINIFARTNRGITVTPEGTEFLGYARQIVQQAELIESKFIAGGSTKQRFSVSTQHYSFTSNAFVDLIKEFGGDEYDFVLRETRTYDMIEDVKTLRSELGVLYLSSFNEKVILRLLKESNLIYTELFEVKPHIFISKNHEYAKRDILRLEDLEDLAYLSFDQGETNSFYFSEEVLSTRKPKKSIRVSDRAAIVNLLIGLDAYTISTGVYPSYLHGYDIVAVPLDVDETIRVCVIQHKDYTPTRLATIYMDALKRIAESVK